MRDRVDRRFVLLIVCTLMLVCFASRASSTTFQGEAEGYVGDSNDFYLRVLHQFKSSGSTVGLFGYTHTWNLANQQNVRGFLWYRIAGDGETESWIGPEVWPHINLSSKVTLDAEIRYLFGLGDAKDRFSVFAWPMYQLDSKNSLGLIVTHTEIIDGPSQPWFLGPQYLYTIDTDSLLAVSYVEGLEESAGKTFTIDYVWRYK